MTQTKLHDSKLRDELLNLEVFYSLGEAEVLIPKPYARG